MILKHEYQGLLLATGTYTGDLFRPETLFKMPALQNRITVFQKLMDTIISLNSNESRYIHSIIRCFFVIIWVVASPDWYGKRALKDPPQSILRQVESIGCGEVRVEWASAENDHAQEYDNGQASAKAKQHMHSATQS